jgi:hypothetical protein
MIRKSMFKNALKILMLFVFLGSLMIIGPSSPVHATNPLFPNLKTLPPRDLRFDRTDVSQDSSGVMHNVLRFSNTVYNVGEGKLEMWGNVNPSGIAYQRVYDTNGTYTDSEVGIFYYHAIHDHYHFENWGQFQLWKKAEYDQYVASGGTQAEFSNAGVKTTSCVLDEEFITTLTDTPYPGVYPWTGCIPSGGKNTGKIVEGLSVGWGDTYDYYRYEQWIDLDQETLADGQYVLRSITDPLNKIYESAGKSDPSREGVADNEAITPFTVSGGQIIDTLPPSGTVYINDVQVSTLNPNVTVKVVGRDDVSGVQQVRLSNDGINWSAYIPYTGVQSLAQSISWNLADPAYGGSSQIGLKTVYVQFQDVSGKVSSNQTDTIILGAIPATSGYSTAVLGDNPVSYWRLSEDSGTTAIDNQGANHGTYNNNPMLGAPGLISQVTPQTKQFFLMA